MAKYRTREVVVEARDVTEYEEIAVSTLGTHCADEGDTVLEWNGFVFVLPEAVFNSLFEPVEVSSPQSATH